MAEHFGGAVSVLADDTGQADDMIESNSGRLRGNNAAPVDDSMCPSRVQETKTACMHAADTRHEKVSDENNAKKNQRKACLLDDDGNNS